MRLNFRLVRTFLHLVDNDMNIFTQKMNPVTGRMEWELQREDYDFHQEVARSAYADMLHDTERNKKYHAALKLAIEKMHAVGRRAHVLDIGTGTGLLSMMAAKCGADTIVACEGFLPMAKCADQVMKDNGLSEKIRLIPKRSTELTVGSGCDMEHRANILVTEVFDTELIGEGAILTLNHARQELLEEDCIVVPSSATVYAQVVESELAQKWNKLTPLCFDAKTERRELLSTPPELLTCPGAAAVHDLQLTQFPFEEFRTIIAPVPVLKFDWSKSSPIPRERTCFQQVKVKQSGVAQVVFMWWDLVMDTEGKIILSCAPKWAHPVPEELTWRDHWMQALYYLPKEVPLAKDEEVALVSCHDEFSLWFSLGNSVNELSCDTMRPVCNCGLHMAISRTRIGAMNDEKRHQLYLSALSDCVTEDSVCLCLSDGSLYGVAAAKLGAKVVYCVETNPLAQRVLAAYISHHHVKNVVILDNKLEEMNDADMIGKITLVFGEPHFFTTLLPWHNLYFWYWKNDIGHLLDKTAVTVPCYATVWGMAVEFLDLWKIRAPLHDVEGFKMKRFDMLIEDSRTISDSAVEAHPLWEYPCRALSRPFQVMKFDFTQPVVKKKVTASGSAVIEGSGTCNGVALWVDWHLDPDSKYVVTTGPVATPQINKKIMWDMHTRQGVYFFNDSRKVRANSVSCSMDFSAEFVPDTGDIIFGFDVMDKPCS